MDENLKLPGSAVQGSREEDGRKDDLLISPPEATHCVTEVGCGRP